MFKFLGITDIEEQQLILRVMRLLYREYDILGNK